MLGVALANVLSMFQDGQGRLVVVLAPGLKMLMVAFEPQDASVALYLEPLRRASHAGTAEPPSAP